MKPNSERELHSPVRIIIAIVVFIIVLIAISLSVSTVLTSINGTSLFYYGGVYNNPLVYQKEDGIYVYNLGQNSSYKIDNTLCDKSQFSKDGKRLYILSRGNLSYINFNEANYEEINPVKISSDVTDFVASEDGRYCIFRVGQHSLYLYKENSESRLLANNVFSDFYINETDGNVVYTIYNSDLCVYNVRKNHTIRTNNVNYYIFENNNSQKLYFLRGDTIYKKDKTNEPVTISKGMTNLISVDTGIFGLSERNGVFILYKISGNTASVLDRNIIEISDDFGKQLIYKRRTPGGYETCCLEKSGKSLKIFDDDTKAENYTINKNGDSLYAIINYKNNPSVLCHFSLTASGVSDRKIIAEDILSYRLLDDGSVIYTNNNGTYLYHSNKSTLLSTISVTDITTIGDSVYMSERTEPDTYDILRVKNGAVQFLAENTTGDFDALTASDILYIKEGDIFFKHGTEESRIIDNNAKSIIKTTKYE